MWEVIAAALILIAFWALQVANAIAFATMSDSQKAAELCFREHHRQF